MPNVTMRDSEPHASRSLLWLGLLALLPLVCAAGTAGAQPTRPVRVWSEVGSVLAPGMPLRVTTRSASARGAARLEGHMASFSADALVLRRDGATESITATLITRIERADARSRRVWRLGIPLGAVAGGLITMLIDAQSTNPEPAQAFGMGAVLIGMPVGAATAAALPVQPLYVASTNGERR